MASKKAGRLAGLAALAGLAYMANKKGETKDAVKSETKETPAPDRDDSERVIGSRVRKDDDITVAGEGGFDTPADMSSSPRVGTPARTASSVKAPSASAASQTGRFAPSGSPVLSDNPRKTGNAKSVVAQGGNRSARADMQAAGKTGNASPVVAQGGDRSTRSDNAKPVFAPGGNRSVRNLDYENDETKEMKRGGKVKKMASGGMASKRGDGIASKGKTRCKMY